MNAAYHNFTFEALANGQLGVTPTYGAFLAEAASYCLYVNAHSNPVRMRLSGDVSAEGSLKWRTVDSPHAGTYADLKEATEYGAYAVGIIVSIALTGFSKVKRSAQGTGIDLWLGRDSDDPGIFQHAARLEVSGILKGDESAITQRLNIKLKQTEPTDRTGLPAHIAIVEFSSPETRLVNKGTGEMSK